MKRVSRASLIPDNDHFWELESSEDLIPALYNELKKFNKAGEDETLIALESGLTEEEILE